MSEPTPLFIPLKSKYYEAFVSGDKKIEYRKYGNRWNERTCHLYRPVTLSKGYGKKHRISGVITGFWTREMNSKEWLDCYGEPGEAACIEILLLQFIRCFCLDEPNIGCLDCESLRFGATKR